MASALSASPAADDDAASHEHELEQSRTYSVQSGPMMPAWTFSRGPGGPSLEGAQATRL